MSNPSRAPRESVTAVNESEIMPDCHLPFIYENKDEKTHKNAWDAHCKGLKSVVTLQTAIDGLDMRIEQPFIIPPELTVDKPMKQSGDYRASAKRGKLTTRPRTDYARDVLNVGYRLLPAQLRSDVASKAVNLALADGGAEHTNGRLQKAYPKKGSRILEPISEFEAKVVWREEVGMDLTDEKYFNATLTEEEKVRLPFYGEPGERAVKMNVHASNGFPVLGNIGDDEARAKVLGLAQRVRLELEDAYERDPLNGVEEWVRLAEKERPWLVACQGKAKGDYYTGEKIEADMLRFYVCMGRQIALNIQTAAQLLDQHASSILDNPHCRSASGVAMNHDGAARLVDALERQLHDNDEAHVRMGDDSWVIILIGEHLLMFALDGSNFDLTQHAAMTQNVHKQVRQTVALWDAIAAQLQHTYFRQRLVVTLGTLVRTFFHGGVSGMQGQPKVNGTIMGTGIRRTCRRIEAELSEEDVTEEAVNKIIAGVGRGMGITIKVEQYSYTKIPTSHQNSPIKYVLSQRSFLFLGYHFYNEDNILSVHTDMARAMSQSRYPTLKWVVEKKDLEPMELGRLAATLLGWGRPTKVLEPVFNALKTEILERINRYLKTRGDFEDERLRWAVSVGDAAGLDTAMLASLAGVARALSRSWDENWLERKEVSISSAESDSTVVTTQPSASVLDAWSRKVNIDLKIAVPSRRPTKKTDGRNPNTKVFAPALSPKPKSSRVHENQGWERSRRAEADADAWAAQQVERDQVLDALVRSDPNREEDMPADEMDSDRYGEELTDRELEEHLDSTRWKI